MTELSLRLNTRNYGLIFWLIDELNYYTKINYLYAVLKLFCNRTWSLHYKEDSIYDLLSFIERNRDDWDKLGEIELIISADVEDKFDVTLLKDYIVKVFNQKDTQRKQLDKTLRKRIKNDNNNCTTV